MAWDRIDRIGPRTEGPDGLFGVSAARRVDREEPDAEERRRDASRHPRREPRPEPEAPQHPPAEPGHVDISV